MIDYLLPLMVERKKTLAFRPSDSAMIVVSDVNRDVRSPGGEINNIL